MKQFITLLRMLIWIPIFAFVIASIYFMAYGGILIVQTVIGHVNGTLTENNFPGMMVAKTLDVLLFSVVLVVFSIGMISLFFGENHDEWNVPGWMRISNLTSLKILLWESVMTVVVFIFLIQAYKSFLTGEILDWSILIYPTAVLILALAAYLVKRYEHIK